MSPPLAPTPNLRWYQRHLPGQRGQPKPVLQQWWAPDVPGYMISRGEGEWREVRLVEEEQ
jgi:hypothetical protein